MRRVGVRLNNLLLDEARVEYGWVVFNVRPEQVAVGENLLGIRFTQRDETAADVALIEKVELQVKYGQA